jgi:tRNA (cmo5U34)-methyltransferase
MSDRDDIFQAPESGAAPFRFDARVAAVFEDMIERSVPGYRLTLDLLGTIAGAIGADAPRCYDLGCSLGAATLAMLRGARSESMQVIAVDNSPDMIAQARRQFERAGLGGRVDLRCADLRDTPVESADLVVLNFTLQFVPLADREALLRRIASGLRPGGRLVLSEKLQFDDAAEQHLLTELHHAFKHDQGYSRLEIARKRSALERVLVPEMLATHRQRLQRAGFRRSTVWLQCFNFVSLLAEP